MYEMVAGKLAKFSARHLPITVFVNPRSSGCIISTMQRRKQGIKEGKPLAKVTQPVWGKKQGCQ